MKVLVTGASGLVGKRLMPLLRKNGFDAYGLSRSKREGFFRWDIQEGFIEEGAIRDLHGIIHLAGEPVAQRWSDAAKKKILNSRVDTAQLLFDTCQKQNVNLPVFISASGSNYYGTRTTQDEMQESQPPAKDFLGDVCAQWENSAQAFSELGARVCCLRTGIVLAKEGGALPKMLPPFRACVGSPIGTGKQAMPCIHVDDLCNMYLFALQNSAANGAFNAAADSPTNAEFSKNLANALGRPMFMPNVPGFMLKAIFGQMADILLEGSPLSNKKIKGLGFEFQFKTSQEMLNAIFR